MKNIRTTKDLEKYANEKLDYGIALSINKERICKRFTPNGEKYSLVYCSSMTMIKGFHANNIQEAVEMIDEYVEQKRMFDEECVNCRTHSGELLQERLEDE